MGDTPTPESSRRSVLKTTGAALASGGLLGLSGAAAAADSELEAVIGGLYPHGTYVDADMTVEFDGYSSSAPDGASIESYDWEFEAYQTNSGYFVEKSGIEVDHYFQYASEGEQRRVRLTVTDTNGNTDTDEITMSFY